VANGSIMLIPVLMKICWTDSKVMRGNKHVYMDMMIL
jgi:hypothetical protein